MHSTTLMFHLVSSMDLKTERVKELKNAVLDFYRVWQFLQNQLRV